MVHHRDPWYKLSILLNIIIALSLMTATGFPQLSSEQIRLVNPVLFPPKAHPPANLETDTADVHWDNRFTGASGVAGTVYAMASIGNDIYFGGDFTATDKIPANSIVKWNSVTGAWTALGPGLDGQVLAIAVMDSVVYAGGSFTHAGGLPVNHVAKWDGKSWSALGTSPNDGTDSIVNCLAVIDTDLYAGGDFVNAGGIEVNHIARWNGTQWTDLKDGLGGNVFALAASGQDLYVGGSFTANVVIPTRLNHVGRWNGVGWQNVGSGFDDDVVSLAVDSPYVYAGGYFYANGKGSPVPRIARCDGVNDWAPLGTGLTQGFVVQSIVFSGSHVYAAGTFTAFGITTANNIAVWDTVSLIWSPLGDGLTSYMPVTVTSLLMKGADLYAGGSFFALNSGPSSSYVNAVAIWNVVQWRSLGTSSSNAINDGYISAVSVAGNDVYVGGSFSSVGSIEANNIAVYNARSNTWSSLGTGTGNGVGDRVFAIAVADSADVYVGGEFTTAGGNPAHYIAKWNGTSWSTLGAGGSEGVNSVVFSLAAAGANLYVGGSFTMAGGYPSNYVAMWDGTSWSTLGVGMNNTVYALALSGNDLYAGGSFTQAGGSLLMQTVNHANMIARWDGNNWYPLGTPPNDGVSGPTGEEVTSLVSIGRDIFVGGNFRTAAGSTIPASGFARWDGTSWAALGNRVLVPPPETGTMAVVGVDGLAASGGSVYATGTFQIAGMPPVNSIARWDTAAGGSWNGLGSGLSDAGYAIAVSGNDVYIGGVFVSAGGRMSPGIAHWNSDVILSSVKIHNGTPAGFFLAQNYPNPFNPTTTIGYELSANSFVTLKVYDILGREIATLVNEKENAGKYSVSFDGSRLASGVYFYQFRSGDYLSTKKILLVK